MLLIALLIGFFAMDPAERLGIGPGFAMLWPVWFILVLLFLIVLATEKRREPPTKKE